MDSLIIKPKDQAELDFFLELAKRVGAEVHTLEDIQDRELLDAMEANRQTPKIDKQEILNTLHTILNEPQADYNK